MYVCLYLLYHENHCMHVNIICNSSVQAKSDILDLKILAMSLIHFCAYSSKKVLDNR